MSELINEWTKTLNEKQEAIEQLRRDLQRAENTMIELKYQNSERDKMITSLMHDLAAEKKLSKLWEDKLRRSVFAV